MSFCCAFVLLVGLARARCPHKSAYVRRAFIAPSRTGAICAPPTARVRARPTNRIETPRICWQTIFICGKPLWYGKPLKQLGLSVSPLGHSYSRQVRSRRPDRGLNRRNPARQKSVCVLAPFCRGNTYDHIRRACSARMIYFLSESRTRAEPQDKYFPTGS
jgi:hypothetical protein